MVFTKTKLKDACIIELEELGDKRGFFARAYCRNEFAGQGIDFNVKQANVSYNRHKGTLRGMHYQKEPYGEAKLLRCTRGAVYDVIIDVRPNSPTFKQWTGVELTEGNRRMLYVPEGFAHGFLTLEDDTEVSYKVSEFYTPNAEKGIRWNDPAFNIEWPGEVTVISDKDKQWADFQK